MCSLIKLNPVICAIFCTYSIKKVHSQKSVALKYTKKVSKFLNKKEDLDEFKLTQKKFYLQVFQKGKLFLSHVFSFLYE